MICSPGFRLQKKCTSQENHFLSVFVTKTHFDAGAAACRRRKATRRREFKGPRMFNFSGGSHESPEKSAANCRKQFVSLSTWNGFHPNTTLDVEIKLKTDKVFVFGASAMEFSFVRRNAFVKSEASHENFVRRYVVSIDLRKSNP